MKSKNILQRTGVLAITSLLSCLTPGDGGKAHAAQPVLCGQDGNMLPVKSPTPGRTPEEPATKQASLRILSNDGDIEVPFDKQPEISFPQQGVMQLSFAGETQELVFANVQEFNFTVTTANSIAPVTHNAIKIGMSGNHITLSGMQAGDKATLYDSKGKLILQAKPDTGGHCTVSTAKLPAGPYVVKSGKHSFKFIKR